MISENIPRVGVGLIVLKEDRILLGKRKGSHGEGEFAGAGGHVELLESFESTALRELAEEAGKGFKITTPKFLCVTNLRKYQPKHYIDIGMVANWVSGEPQVMEPDKLEFWAWYDMNNLPSPLFGVIPNYIEAIKTTRSYFSD